MGKTVIKVKYRSDEIERLRYIDGKSDWIDLRAAEDVEMIRRAAYNVGIAFQVQDDILDETGDEATLGKEVGQDARNEKTTYVTLHGMEAAKNFVSEKTEDANRMLRKLFPKEEGKAIGSAAEDLIGLLCSLVGRTS